MVSLCKIFIIIKTLTSKNRLKPIRTCSLATMTPKTWIPPSKEIHSWVSEIWARHSRQRLLLPQARRRNSPTPSTSKSCKEPTRPATRSQEQLRANQAKCLSKFIIAEGTKDQQELAAATRPRMFTSSNHLHRSQLEVVVRWTQEATDSWLPLPTSTSPAKTRSMCTSLDPESTSTWNSLQDKVSRPTWVASNTNRYKAR